MKQSKSATIREYIRYPILIVFHMHVKRMMDLMYLRVIKKSIEKYTNSKLDFLLYK